jgi:hypothetical protein
MKNKINRVFEFSRFVSLFLVFVLGTKAFASEATKQMQKYPPQKLSASDLEKGLSGILAKGLEGAQKHKSLGKIEPKSCYDSGHANGSLFYATQVSGLDWKQLEIVVNQKLKEKKLQTYSDYGAMITELVSDWQKCIE